MSNQRISGMLQFALDGVLYQASGDWTYNLGLPKRESVRGSDSVAGYKEEPQVPFIEGEVIDNAALDTKALLSATGVTAYLTLGNGKVIALRDGVQVGEGTGNATEGKIPVRFEGTSCEEIA